MPFAPEATVADILDADPELSTFNNLVRRSGVIARLDGPGPYTVFAPTNAAFDVLPPNALGDLVEHPHRLEHVMSYHIARGGFRGGSIREFDRLPTLHGTDVSVVVTEQGVVVGGAGLEDTDIPATNGLVHKISSVMFPE